MSCAPALHVAEMVRFGHLLCPFQQLAMRQGVVVAPFDGKVAYAGGASYIAVECGDTVGVFPHDVQR